VKVDEAQNRKRMSAHNSKSIQIGAPASATLFSLLSKTAIPLDYITVYGSQGMNVLQPALAYKPVLLHDVSNTFWLNYEDPFTDQATVVQARAMLDAAKSPWFSTGIGASAEPQGHTSPYWRGADASALQSRERAIENIIRNGKRLSGWAGVPLLLENYNYHPTNAYEYVCEPDTFSMLIDAIGCDVLLDVAHARISAHNMGWSDPHRYFEALPLGKVLEMHINQPGYDAQTGQIIDHHAPLQPEDLTLLPWLLERCPRLEAITIESERGNEGDLLREISLVRETL
jgi:uncharacterized protein (UPF0276 family)